MKRHLSYISNAVRKSKSRARNPKGRHTRYTYADFKAYKKRYKYAIRVAKRDSFRQFMSETSSTPKEISTIGKRVVKQTRAQNLGALENEEGIVLDPQDSMEYLADTHFADSVPIHNGKLMY